MCHKAYALDYEEFSVELAPILYRALETGHNDDLTALIDANHQALTFPWDGTPLPEDWRSSLELGDTHELGDLALTKYYDAAEDCGLQDYWLVIQNTLPRTFACRFWVRRLVRRRTFSILGEWDHIFKLP